jgi:hypothetical protein
MPEKAPDFTTEVDSMKKATDIILPEINQTALLSNDGQVLILLMTRRLVTPDRCFSGDITLLYNRFKVGVMPIFSGGRLLHLDTPFVDPMDAEENVRSLSSATSAEARAEVRS